MMTTDRDRTLRISGKLRETAGCLAAQFADPVGRRVDDVILDANLGLFAPQRQGFRVIAKSNADILNDPVHLRFKAGNGFVIQRFEEG